MTDKIKKIREEVAKIQLYTQSEVLKQVLDYIDKVQQEPVSEDLEEAAHKYADIRMSNYETAFYAFMSGAKWQKEQMMAKAKSGTVQKDNQVILDNGTYIDLDPSMQLKPSFVGLKEGDRIKVIIIKEK